MGAVGAVGAVGARASPVRAEVPLAGLARGRPPSSPASKRARPRSEPSRLRRSRPSPSIGLLRQRPAFSFRSRTSKTEPRPRGRPFSFRRPSGRRRLSRRASWSRRAFPPRRPRSEPSRLRRSRPLPSIGPLRQRPAFSFRSRTSKTEPRPRGRPFSFRRPSGRRRLSRGASWSRRAFPPRRPRSEPSRLRRSRPSPSIGLLRQRPAFSFRSRASKTEPRPRGRPFSFRRPSGRRRLSRRASWSRRAFPPRRPRSHGRRPRARRYPCRGSAPGLCGWLVRLSCPSLPRWSPKASVLLSEGAESSRSGPLGQALSAGNRPVRWRNPGGARDGRSARAGSIPPGGGGARTSPGLPG